jgi:ABC-type transport system substrate-binding protein
MVAFSLVDYPAFNHFDLYGTAWDIRANTRGWNPGGYSNAEVDAAIGAYFASVTTEDMRNALTSLQRAANSDLFGLWFGFPDDLVLVRQDIQGFLPNMYIQTYSTRSWWRGEGEVVDGATPVASPAGTPDTAIPVVILDPATPEAGR